jgi:hypothetical protein
MNTVTPNRVLKNLHFLTVGQGESEPTVIILNTHIHVVHIKMKQTDSCYADLYLYGGSLLYVGFDWKKTMNEKTGNTKTWTGGLKI